MCNKAEYDRKEIELNGLDWNQLVAKNYDKSFNELSLKKPFLIHSVYSAYHLYPVRIKENRKGITQKGIFNNISSRW